MRGRLYGYHDSRVNLSVAYETDERGGVPVLDEGFEYEVLLGARGLLAEVRQ